MYRDDFVLRHIRLFIQSILRAVGLIKEGDLGFALDTIRVAFQDLLGMSLDDFLAYPEDRLMDFLYFGELEVMGLNRTAFAANMLLQAGRVYKAQGKGERSTACFERALHLLLETTLSAEDDLELPDFTPPVDELLEEVELGVLNDAILTQLAFFFERAQEFRRADQAIRLLLDRSPEDPDVRDLARSFYKYLLEEDERALAEGGMTVEKVREGLRELGS